MPKMNTYDILVVGAGIFGITTALEKHPILLASYALSPYKTDTFAQFSHNTFFTFLSSAEAPSLYQK